MLEAVPARIVGRGAEAEVGPEVDDGGAAAAISGTSPGGGPVGEGQEDRVDLGQVGLDRQARSGQVRMAGADRLMAVAALEPDDLDRRMAAEQADQLGADVARCADDPDPDPAVRGIRPAIRRDRDRWLDSRAHGRAGVRRHARSLAGDGFEVEAVGRKAAMTA